MGKLDYLNDRSIVCHEFDIICSGTTPCCQCSFIHERDAELIKEEAIQAPFDRTIHEERMSRIKRQGKA